MKKIIIGSLLALAAGYFAYKVWLPQFVVRSVVSEKENVITRAVPQEVKKQIKKAPEIAASISGSREEAVNAIDNLNVEDLLAGLERLNQSGYANSAEAADAVLDPVALSPDEEHRIRRIITEEFSVAEIRNIQQALNQHRESIPLMFPVFKEIFKQAIKNPELFHQYKEALDPAAAE